MCVFATNPNRSVIVEAIGPQRNKTQAQANQKTTNDEEQEFSDAELAGSSAKLGATNHDDSASTCSNPDVNRSSVAAAFEDRLKKYKAEQMKILCENDKAEFENPQNISEFSQQIYESMKKHEVECMVPVDYLTKVQTEIKDTSRAFLIEWVIDVHRKFRLNPEALYVSIFIIDQFLSKQHLQKSQLHLLGVATLLISSKYEEIYPPTLQDFLAVSENKFT